jgi:sorbitol-specific phosphotransferase system component IIC
MMDERQEALMRILVGIVTGIILALWRGLIQVISIFHWIYVLITNKRIKELAKFCHIWNCQVYMFLKYMTFATNKRPFPFDKLAKVDKADFKKYKY